jgi:hypothetical protein
MLVPIFLAVLVYFLVILVSFPRFGKLHQKNLALLVQHPRQMQQGCQIILGTTYQKTYHGKNIPNNHKLYRKAVK